jgi:uncharacterized protein YecE (DUF72 family)
MKWWIGCSGFHYKEWKNVFYPDKLAQRKWFDYYSERFYTIELNVTFYRFPQLAFLQNWYQKSPDEFLFAVKVPRLITHFKQLKDCERYLSDFYGTIREGLKNKLGPVLFQFPPKLGYSDEILERIVTQLDLSFTNAIEFRHQDWWNDDVYKALGRKKIIFCGISHPSLPDEAIVNTSKAYYRFHGVHKLYYSSYSEEKLREIAFQLKANKKLKEVYIYFNNTASVAAIENITRLKSILELP